MSTIHADVLVVGFGKGGKTVAAKLGKQGKKVVLAEQSDQMYGGTCPNVGCVPTKALVHHSRKRRPEDSPQEWYARSVREIHELTSKFRAGNREAMENAETITLLTGRARFTGPHTVEVAQAGGDVTVTAETIVVNTGSEPIVPDVPGLRDSKRLVTSTDLIHSPDLPERLVIIGAGYLGLEFASIYGRFGSRVTVLEAAPDILGRLDEDVAEATLDVLRGEGVEFVTRAEVTEVRDGLSQTDVVYERDGRRESVGADAVLAATGRAPVTRGLNLEAAGVRTDGRGAIVVDERLRTSQPHIFALGDVNGGPQFTYISLDDSRVVLDHLNGSGRRATTDRMAIPMTLFITPPLATVGFNEREARAAGHRVKVAKQAVADIVAMPRAHVVEETRGLVKFVIDADTDEILGAALLSIDAQEIVNTVALAMRHHVTAAELRDAVYTHPSSTEAFNDVLATIAHTDEPAG
ncbi:Pyruvate/2-oxoglutarate dehydrogenase complex, dihydrolipoamide dehydrogenase (E3) component [Nonomuraea maritima]|uniref:Pyruvate/2-oxoglutarate dehydrogenase complex, dihydrolipoamide dehydrogenase (E3) component n=1 Tax=Nonomuraea maritima TaxID=683260 RepID=A0A1G9EUA4_9ACTN|nr:FAD-dependent oxidoreductase [Nonomuraea maritima]SDK79700.1 Pyruvate/2-oxoglutarate dehydrogenase complex, dihydrolipoamide dehydrogenase (E3) component [Nonomuraea maritima]